MLKLRLVIKNSHFITKFCGYLFLRIARITTFCGYLILRIWHKFAKFAKIYTTELQYYCFSVSSISKQCFSVSFYV